jgi:autotransporter-associated beta strand protein
MAKSMAKSMANGAQATAQSITLTLPAGFNSGSFTSGGSNTGLNAFAPLLVNGTLPLRVIKDGPGTWQLTNANTYSGGTTINGGRLLVNNATGSGTGSGAVVVGAGGPLGGTESISGAVTIQNGGTLNPGNSPGILSVNNNVTFEDGSTFFVELNGAAAGNGAGDHDQLVLTGAANTPTLSAIGAGVTLAGSVGFMPTGADVLRIVDNQGNNSIVGTFAGLAEGSQVQFGPFWTALISDVGGTGNDIVRSNFSPVPEPGSFALVGVGAWFVRRRRHRAGKQG